MLRDSLESTPLQRPAVSEAKPARLQPVPTAASTASGASHPQDTVSLSDQPLHAKYNGKDVSFAQFSSLLPKQQSLLRDFFHADNSAAANKDWGNLVTSHPDQAATFLANTKALSDVTFELPNEHQKVSALDTISGIDQLKDDRMLVDLDNDSTKRFFDMWTKEGGHYSMQRADGKVENGHIHMDHGDLHGSLHEGYTEQGFTSNNAPRIQWNVVLPGQHKGSTAQPGEGNELEADIDIDYRSPWIWGFIPNPLHLTHENSVVLDHYKTYTKKWGNPGFTVS